MRIVFLILLAANVAYWIVTHYHFDKHDISPPVQINPEKITLVPALETCLVWGNFYEEQIQYAEKTLSTSFPNLTYSIEESDRTVMYWLYIPPYSNKEAANRDINKLRNLGIVSFRVKDNTQWENAISLGIFYDQNDALQKMREIEKKGVNQVKIESRHVALQKIIIQNPSVALKEQLYPLVEQFDDTQLTQDKCERL